MNQIYKIGLLTLGMHFLHADAPENFAEGLIVTPNYFFTTPEGGTTTDEEETPPPNENPNQKHPLLNQRPRRLITKMKKIPLQNNLLDKSNLKSRLL